jgi:hypothetical protein
MRFSKKSRKKELIARRRKKSPALTAQRDIQDDETRYELLASGRVDRFSYVTLTQI